MSRKSSWIQSIFSWLLPPLVGTAVGVGLISILREDTGLRAALPTHSTSSVPSTLVKRAPDVKPQIQAAVRVPTEKRPAPLLTKPKGKTEQEILVEAARAEPPPPPWQWKPLEHPVNELFRTKVPDTGGLPLLYQAVLNDDAEWISDLIARGANPNEPTPGGDTALCAAIRQMSATCVRTLLMGGADPTLTGFEKQPPLALASLRRGTDIMKSLLIAGVDPNTRFASPVSKAVLNRVTIRDLKNSLESDRGVTPLIACASRGDVEGAAALLKAGAKPSQCTTRYHRYPINFAAAQGYLFLMRIILGRQPESEPTVLVTVDLSSQRAWVTREGKIMDSTSISTGRAGYRTPSGRYIITDKHRSWVSTLYHVSMPFFMRLNCGAIGLHSGHVTGRPASHGCIRLPYDKARKFFSLVDVGDEVQIVN